MPIETGMYNTKPPEPFNPLVAMQQLTGIQNAVQQNQALQLQNKLTQAQQRTGQIFSKNIDDDGGVDTTNALIQVSKDPIASIALPMANELVNKLQEPVSVMGDGNTPGFKPRQDINRLTNTHGKPLYAKNSQVDPNKQQELVNTTHSQLDDIISTLAPLVNNPNPSKQDVMNSRIELIQKSHMTPTEAAAEFSDPDLYSDDPEVIKKAVQADFNKYLSHKAGLTSKFGSPSIKPDQTNPNATSHPNNNFVATGLPAGTEKEISTSQDRYKQTIDVGSDARERANIYRNIINLSKTAPTGTIVGDIYTQLAKAGLTSGKDTDPAVQLQEITKYMGNAMQSAGANTGTNEQLHALQKASPNDTQLPQTIQNLSKYLMATTLSSAAKADALQHQVPDQKDAQKELQFQKEWRDNYDPRVIQVLMAETPEERQSILKGLSKQQRLQLSAKAAKLKSMGALDGLQ